MVPARSMSSLSHMRLALGHVSGTPRAGKMVLTWLISTLPEKPCHGLLEGTQENCDWRHAHVRCRSGAARTLLTLEKGE